MFVVFLSRALFVFPICWLANRGWRRRQPFSLADVVVRGVGRGEWGQTMLAVRQF